MEDLKQGVESKYTYIAAWAGNAELYSLIRCNNETYERKIVASFDELSKHENAALANKCANILNEKPAEREAKLVEALKPFAAVGRLKSITRHPDSGLWSHQAGSQDEGHVYTRITSADCILAEATLTELGIANKGEV